ncbi:hypothetical protein JD844_009923, partial [Phrynosoma platyrhinos]
VDGTCVLKWQTTQLSSFLSRSFISWYLLAYTKASSMYGEILSPNYPQAYPNDAQESWEISVPPGYGIHLYFTHLDIEPSQNCEYDFVKVMSGNHVEGQLCGRKTRRHPGSLILEEFHVPFNTLTVTFQSDFSNEERFTGFAAYYTAVDVNECTDFVEDPCSHYCNNYIGGYFCSCPAEYFLHEDQKTCGVNCTGNMFTELSGEITSPNYPDLYPENSQCDYRVSLEPGYQVVLTIGKKDFDVEPAGLEGNCHDALRILAGDEHFGPYCGNIFTGPPEIRTRTNIVDIFFQTDHAMQGKGWKLRYFGDPMPCPKTIIPNSVLDPIRDRYVFKDSVMVTCAEGYEVVMLFLFFSYFLPLVCGVPHTPIEETGRIFGGTFAKAGNFPWQIYFETPRGGGALISDRWILTAAHVVDGYPNPTVYAGLLLVGPNAMKEASPLDVAEPIIHPGWTKSTGEHRTNFDNDIALLRLNKPVTLGPTISPICLPGTSSEYDPQIGTTGFVAGWGTTETRKSALKLKSAKIPVHDMDVCRRVKPDPPADTLTYVYTDNMICAGDGRRDSCYGDSGGAYAIQDPHNETRYYVAGLVSWGPKCGTYGLYTKVANYVDWIVGVMSQYREPED